MAMNPKVKRDNIAFVAIDTNEYERINVKQNERLKAQQTKQLSAELTIIGSGIYKLLSAHNIDRDKLINIALDFNYIAIETAKLEASKAELISKLFSNVNEF